ncbi:MAG TPA: hypothetical protein DCQ30_03230, partial [Acidimicrobiaceae bacterium]|nr:hypothetical protein [Acidimicrobiaceae bacterium]
GSFVAARIAPVAAPSLLVVYTMTPTDLAEKLDLLPSDAGTNTVLIRPDNDVPFWNAEISDGLRTAALSQVAMDCWAGVGRMPSEGEALISWMQANEEQWRHPSIDELPRRHERPDNGH